MPLSPTVTRRTKACEECRQQKLRCDAHLDYSKPCSRCRRSGMDCTFTSNFKRRKNKPKWELQREIDNLRRSQDLTPDDAAIAANTVPPQPGINNHLLSGNRPLSIATGSVSHSDYPPVSASTTFVPSLEGFVVEPRKLDDCLELFMKHYYPILPIMEPNLGCKDYYSYSPLLFWTMIVTGSRRYSLDPTLLEILAPKVANLAALAAIRVSEYVQTITALLILLAWPIPMEDASDDPSPVFAGIAMQLALQHGLHMLSKRQDFSQKDLANDSSQEQSRARLWAWCKVICHCTNIFCGLHHQTFEDAFEIESYGKAVFDSSDSTFWMQKVDVLLSKAMNTLTQYKYERESMEPGQLLSMIKVFDDGIQRIKNQSHGLLADIWFSSTRLHVCVYQFFVMEPTSKLPGLVELYYLACRFVDNITSRDRQDDYALYISEQYFRTLTLAAMTILRIYRSTELNSKVDLLLGERSYFAAIQVLKKRVLKNNDINARTAAMFSQLWQSKRIFQQPDGSIDSLSVRIRSRGSMGIVYDCFWYWRKEFLGQPNPYQDETNQGLSETTTTTPIPTPFNLPGNTASSLVTTSQIPESDENWFQSLVNNDAFYSEWNWSTNDYLPTELLDTMSASMGVN